MEDRVVALEDPVEEVDAPQEGADARVLPADPLERPVEDGDPLRQGDLGVADEDELPRKRARQGSLLDDRQQLDIRVHLNRDAVVSLRRADKQQTPKVDKSRAESSHRHLAVGMIGNGSVISGSFAVSGL